MNSYSITKCNKNDMDIIYNVHILPTYLTDIFHQCAVTGAGKRKKGPGKWGKVERVEGSGEMYCRATDLAQIDNFWHSEIGRGGMGR